MPPPTDDDPLATLRASIKATEDAARRLAGASGPTGDWSAQDANERATELQALAALVDSLRSMVPAELREQVQEVVRQILLLVRALIDWLVERIERPAPGPRPAPDLEDIPLD